MNTLMILEQLPPKGVKREQSKQDGRSYLLEHAKRI